MPVPTAISTWCGSIIDVGIGVRGEGAVDSSQRQDQHAGSLAQVGLAQCLTGEWRTLGHVELLHAELERAFVHHDVDELGDVGPRDERRHAGRTELLRVDDAVGTGVCELGDALVLAGPRHDEQVGHDRPRRQRDEEILGVALQCGDQCPGALDAGGAQRRVERRVADHGRVGHVGDAVGVDVDDHDRLPGLDEVVGDSAADAAPAAHDRVPRHLVDLPIHHPPPDEVTEFAFDHQLHRQGEGVQHRRDAGDDDRDREPLLERC